MKALIKLFLMQKFKGNFFSRGISVQNIDLLLASFNNNLAICGMLCLHPTGTTKLQYYPHEDPTEKHGIIAVISPTHPKL